MQNAYQQLLYKLDQFIRKYYINKTLKGALISLSIILFFFLIFNLLESQFWFSAGTRKLLFYSFVGISLLSLVGLVGFPLLKFFRLGSTLSREQAAQIIGNHFSNIEDKLLNILQLQSQSNSANNALVLASIDQKSAEIQPVPFKKAIDLSKNQKYLRFLLPPLVIILALLFLAPHLITDSTKRLVKNNQEFEKPAPFKFVLQNQDLEVIQFDDYHLKVKTEGNVLPTEVQLNLDGFPYKLKKDAEGFFTYTFKNVRTSLDFTLSSGRVSSMPYTLSVLEKPSLTSMKVKLDYPNYTGISDKTLENTGNLVVPVGTQIEWDLKTEHVQSLDFIYNKKDLELQKNGNTFSAQKQILSPANYAIYVSNEHLQHADSSLYSLEVIQDQYPKINVNRFIDSTDNSRIFFAGEGSDDYGLRRLTFNYSIYRGGQIVKQEQKPISISGNPIVFEYAFLIDSLELNEGDQLKYYFELWDNDGIHGSKSVKSAIMEYRRATKEEFADLNESREQNIKEELKSTLKDQQKLRNQLEELKNKLLNQKSLEWNDKKDFEKILEKQEEIQKRLDELKKEYEKKREEEKDYQQENPEEEQKEEELEKMMEDLEKNDKMEELMKKIQELLQDMKKEEALEQMDEMQKQQEKNEMTTDRLEKLLEQLEFEKEVQEKLEKLDELAQEQEKLLKENEEEKKSPEELAKDQEKLNEKFDELKKEMDQLKKEGEKLSVPKDMDQMEEQMEDIQREMQEALENLEQNKPQDAKGNQKKAQEMMQQMQQQTSSSMSSQSQKQLEEDIKTLRQLLENLVTLSYEQEDVLNTISNVDALTPKYVELTQQQFKLEESFEVVKDTLVAMSKRNFQIQNFVLEKVQDIESSFEKTLAQLEERRTGQANRFQQQSMTSLNDLALMLSEAMQNMQEQMAQMKPGNQMCNKPGGAKPKPGQNGKKGEMPMDKITKGQEKLNDQMKEMAKENAKKRSGEKGEKKGEKGNSSKDGGKKKGGSEGDAEEFAKMAREQAKLRKMLRDIQESKREQGQGDPQLQEIIDQMNKTEEDLVNKRLNNETLKRQQKIITRLLESEKAEREQKEKEERKSEIAQELERKKRPKALEEYLKERSNSIEQIRKVSPTLRPHYKNLVESYYKELQSGK